MQIDELTLRIWYYREKAWFEAQTQATTFPDFLTWVFNAIQFKSKAEQDRETP